MDVLWLPSPNFSTGRGGRRVQWVILHTTEGGFTASVNWLRNRSSQASAHYVVGRDATTQPVQVVQLVREEDTAWTAGNYAVNQASINIEMVGYSRRNPPVDEETLRVTAELVRDICTRHAITVQRVTREGILQGIPGICGHVDVPDPRDPTRGGGSGGHTDPGPYFPWEQFFSLIRGSNSAAVIQLGPFGCHIGGGFRQFFEKYGGVAIFGYPITEEFTENGVTVQYFERARFEHRTDIGKPEDYHVVLGRIGAELLEVREELSRLQAAAREHTAVLREDANRLVSALEVALVETKERVAVAVGIVEQLKGVVSS